MFIIVGLMITFLIQSLNKDIEMENDHGDGYEEIENGVSQLSSIDGDGEKKSTRPSALQLVGPKQGPSRTLWSEISEVINSQILCKSPLSSVCNRAIFLFFFAQPH